MPITVTHAPPAALVGALGYGAGAAERQDRLGEAWTRMALQNMMQRRELSAANYRQQQQIAAQQQMAQFNALENRRRMNQAALLDQQQRSQEMQFRSAMDLRDRQFQMQRDELQSDRTMEYLDRQYQHLTDRDIHQQDLSEKWFTKQQEMLAARQMMGEQAYRGLLGSLPVDPELMAALPPASQAKIAQIRSRMEAVLPSYGTDLDPEEQLQINELFGSEIQSIYDTRPEAQDTAWSAAEKENLLGQFPEGTTARWAGDGGIVTALENGRYNTYHVSRDPNTGRLGMNLQTSYAAPEQIRLPDPVTGQLTDRTGTPAQYEAIRDWRRDQMEAAQEAFTNAYKIWETQVEAMGGRPGALPPAPNPDDFYRRYLGESVSSATSPGSNDGMSSLLAMFGGDLDREATESDVYIADMLASRSGMQGGVPPVADGTIGESAQNIIDNNNLTPAVDLGSFNHSQQRALLGVQMRNGETAAKLLAEFLPLHSKYQASLTGNGEFTPQEAAILATQIRALQREHVWTVRQAGGLGQLLEELDSYAGVSGVMNEFDEQYRMDVRREQRRIRSQNIGSLGPNNFGPGLPPGWGAGSQR